MDDSLTIEIPGILPDNRVIAGQLRYHEPLKSITRDAAYIRGIVGGLDRDGVEVLRGLVAEPKLKQLLLIVTVYPGSRTWDDALLELLSIQNSAPDHVKVRLLARRVGSNRPANLLWSQPSDGGHGYIVTGNVGNLMARPDWDTTDAVVCLPLEPAAAEALRRWFDNLHASSRPLDSKTAAAPRLRPPDGDPEGERLWRDYLEVLNGSHSDPAALPTISAQTGEVEHSVEPTPSSTTTFPRPDPVLLEVQMVLSKGSVVALDAANRAPPLSAPVKADLFGERAETRSGAARRQQSFRVSLFSEEVARHLGARKGAMTDRLALCSLMLRDGVRWVPDTANDLLKVEFDAVEQEAIAALKQATGGKTPEDFVNAALNRIADDCASLAREIAPGRTPPTNLVDQVKADLTARLAKNLEKGMVPGISRSRFQIALSESNREGPWDQVQTFLASAAEFPRKIMIGPRNKRGGLAAKPEPLLAAFNVFGDPLVARYLKGSSVIAQARYELSLLGMINDHPTASPKQRVHALFRLIRGERHETIIAELE